VTVDPSPEIVKRLRERLAVLEAVSDALDRIGEVNDIVDRCDNRSDARAALAGLGYDPRQADAILDLTIGRRTKEARRLLAEEIHSARVLLERQGKGSSD
jgi:DNA gyrase/topoisomerase IV subunit A